MCNIISNILATQLSTVDYVYAYGRRCTFRNGIDSIGAVNNV